MIAYCAIDPAWRVVKEEVVDSVGDEDGHDDSQMSDKSENRRNANPPHTQTSSSNTADERQTSELKPLFAWVSVGGVNGVEAGLDAEIAKLLKKIIRAGSKPTIVFLVSTHGKREVPTDNTAHTSGISMIQTIFPAALSSGKKFSTALSGDLDDEGEREVIITKHAFVC